MTDFAIASSLCVDTDVDSSTVRYPMLGRHQKDKRAIYWKCAYVFFWTSLYFNPGKKHILFTNDRQPVLINAIDIKQKLRILGVEIRITAFERFDPRERSIRFRNAFYKFEAIRCLSELDYPSILLDVDCVWRLQSDELNRLIASGNCLLLQDTYQFGRLSGSHSRHGITQNDLMHIYHTIDPLFDQSFPIWYGGEIIAGSPQNLVRIVDQLELVFKQLKNADEVLRFKNNTGIFDNDEFISSFVYNSCNMPIIDSMNVYTTRVDTSYPRVVPWTLLSNVPIWHMPAEKVRGFPILFDALMSCKNSHDETKAVEQIGYYFGLPERTYGRSIDIKDALRKRMKQLLRRR